MMSSFVGVVQLLHLQEAHVNSCYKHFYYFVVEFKLIDSKEFEPLVSTGIKASVSLYWVTCISVY